MIEFISTVLDLLTPAGAAGADHAVIPLVLALGGMAMGAYNSKRKEDAAREQDNFNGNMAAIDTAYSPFVARQGYKATKTDGGHGMLGGGLQGGLAGFQTGTGIVQGQQKNDVYGQMLEEMKAKKAAQVAQGMGGMGGGYGNQYSGLGYGYSSGFGSMGS